MASPRQPGSTRQLGKAPLVTWRSSVVAQHTPYDVSSRHRGASVPGRLNVLSCPPPLCPHVEFAAGTVLGGRVSLLWSAQPARPGLLQADLEYTAPSGAAGRLAGALRVLGPVRFDVVEGPAAGVNAERYAFDPDLGLHRADLSAAGDVVVGEGSLRALLDALPGTTGETGIVHGLRRLLGAAWDDALDPLRVGADGAPVSWLRRTG